MRTVLMLIFLTFPAISFGLGTEKPFGEVMLEGKVSPFPASAFSGKSGPVPDPNGVKEIKKVLSPYLVLKGDVGFLEISEIFSVSSVEISERYIDHTTIKQTFHFPEEKSRESVILRLQDAVNLTKLSTAIKSIVSCVTGSFWEAGRSWGYEACYMLNHDGEWVLTSYHQWPWGRNEDTINP